MIILPAASRLALRGRGQTNPRLQRKCLLTFTPLLPFHSPLTVLFHWKAIVFYMLFRLPLFQSESPGETQFEVLWNPRNASKSLHCDIKPLKANRKLLDSASGVQQFNKKVNMDTVCRSRTLATGAAECLPAMTMSLFRWLYFGFRYFKSVHKLKFRSQRNSRNIFSTQTFRGLLRHRGSRVTAKINTS